MSVHHAVLFGLAASAGGAAAVALLVRYDRRTPTFKFGAFMGLMSLWAAANVGLVLADSLRWKLLFVQFGHLSVVSLPVAWFVFGLQYADRGDWLSRRRLALVSVVPAAMFVAVMTVPWHSLYYTSLRLASSPEGPLLVRSRGPAYAVCAAHAYGLMLVGTGLIASTAFTHNRLYRRQSALLLVGTAVPWLANGLYLAGAFAPTADADPTPAAFVLVGLPLVAVVRRTDLASFVPVAHDRVFRTLDDPILVCSRADTVVDANRAARAVFGGGVDGEHVSDVLPSVLLADGEPRPVPGSDAGSPTVECVIGVGDGDGPRRYVVCRRPIDPDADAAADPAGGYVLCLRDVTARAERRAALERKNEALEERTAELERKNEQLERLASVISHDLTTPLTTGKKLLRLLRADIDDPDPEVERSLSDLEDVHDGLERFAERLPALARESTDVESPVECDLASVATDAWTVVDTGDLSLSIEGARTLRGDPRRLQQAFENLFENAATHARARPHAEDAENVGTDGRPDGTHARAADGGDRDRSASAAAAEGAGGDRPASGVSTGASVVRVGTIDGPDASGFYVEDDGPGIPPDRRDAVLAFGAGAGGGDGLGLAIVRTVVEAHGWELGVTASDEGGARFEVRVGE